MEVLGGARNRNPNFPASQFAGSVGSRGRRITGRMLGDSHQAVLQGREADRENKDIARSSDEAGRTFWHCGVQKRAGSPHGSPIQRCASARLQGRGKDAHKRIAPRRFRASYHSCCDATRRSIKKADGRRWFLGGRPRPTNVIRPSLTAVGEALPFRVFPLFKKWPGAIQHGRLSATPGRYVLPQGNCSDFACQFGGRDYT